MGLRALLVAAMLVTGLASGLAACRIAGPATPADSAAITEQALPAPEEAAAQPAVPEREPQPEPPPEAAPEPTPEPEAPMLAQQRLLCQQTGGQLMPRAAGIYACVHPTRDAGRSCNAARDCEGLCLARSGTCAPFAPLYGCQEVFTLPGRRETLCTE